MKFYFVVIFLTISCFSCKHKRKEIVLTNPNYLKVIDSLIIDLDSATYPISNNVYCVDSILFIQNEGTLSASLYNLSGKKTGFLDFSDIIKRNKRFSFDNAWLISPDSIFVFSKKSEYTYLFDSNLNLLDSLKMPGKQDHSPEKKIAIPSISTSQIPLFKNGNLYTVGYSLGENINVTEKNKYVVCQTNKNSRSFFVNYPPNYSEKNWGGIYFRMVYDCNIGDSIICISYPASSDIALFNINTKSTVFKKTTPDISNYISPMSTKERSPSKSFIAEHFYGQYSFRGIIYDSYRKLFYRFLLKPTERKYLEKIHMGPQEKYLLVYDSSFKYLGFTELNDSYSHFTYFITKRGLYIQHIKDKKDEDHMCFNIYNPASVH